MIVTADALGRKKTDFNFPVRKPENGSHITTTIDLDYQEIAVDELVKAVKQYRAKSGSVVLTNPATGEVLAMASVPTFDNNRFPDYPAYVRRNRAVTDSFEPGSIFKIVTAAAALELGVMKPADSVDCGNGSIRIGRHILRDTKPHGVLTFQEVIEQSSNIGTYKIAQKTGGENLYKYAQLFGFGSKTGIEQGGETPGTLKKPSQWSKTSLQSIAIGYEVSVNALQILNAYAAVANGGTLMQLHLVKAIEDESGSTVREFHPKKIRRVISEKTARTLTEFFKGVVERGTGEKAKIAGKIIAGKTGTAEKVDPATKSYSHTEHISSFVAYYPADNPRIAGIVMIDAPQGDHYGGTVAAPVLKAIINRISHLPRNTMLTSPLAAADGSRKSTGIWSRIQNLWKSIGEPGRNSVRPASGPLSVMKSDAAASASEKPVLLDIEKHPEKTKSRSAAELVPVPDIRGIPLRDAVKKLTATGLDFEITGSGIVITQTPPPGKRVRPGTVTHIVADRIDDPVNKK